MTGRECTAQVACDRIKDNSSPVTELEAEDMDVNAKETAGFDNRRGKLFFPDGSCFLKESQDDAVSPGGREVFWRFDKKEAVIASQKVRK